jgi:enoyl-CoA hydratase/carnithine racemase
VVQSEEELLPSAKTLALAISKRNPGLVRLVKEMQHKGQAYDIHGALKYELDIASRFYEDMGKEAAKTQQSLSGQFSSRSKL